MADKWYSLWTSSHFGDNAADWVSKLDANAQPVENPGLRGMGKPSPWVSPLTTGSIDCKHPFEGRIHRFFFLRMPQVIWVMFFGSVKFSTRGRQTFYQFWAKTKQQNKKHDRCKTRFRVKVQTETVLFCPAKKFASVAKFSSPTFGSYQIQLLLKLRLALGKAFFWEFYQNSITRSELFRFRLYQLEAVLQNSRNCISTLANIARFSVCSLH